MDIRVKIGHRYRPATRDEVLEAAAQYLIEEKRGARIGTPKDTVELIRTMIAGRDNESFGALFLDTRHRLISAEVLFYGTIDGATVYTRVATKRALEVNAASVVFCHNHPSGTAEPSEADRLITTKLVKALALVEVRVLDHIVVTNTQHTSLAERGWL